jgi:hypothetical protein
MDKNKAHQFLQKKFMTPEGNLCEMKVHGEED